MKGKIIIKFDDETCTVEMWKEEQTSISCLKVRSVPEIVPQIVKLLEGGVRNGK